MASRRICTGVAVLILFALAYVVNCETFSSKTNIDRHNGSLVVPEIDGDDKSLTDLNSMPDYFDFDVNTHKNESSLELCELFTCKGVCGSNIETSNTLCSCQKDCVVWGNCCSDYLTTCREMLGNEIPNFIEKELSKEVDSETTLLRDFGECKKYEGVGYIQIIGKCPPGTSNNDNIGCQSKSKTLIPMSNIDYYFLNFVNIYCALCHGYTTSDLKPWQPEFKCSSSVGRDMQSVFDSCDRTFDMQISNEVLCYPYENTTSESGFGDTNLVRLCRSYIRPVNIATTIARNIHCAHLRNLNMSDITSYVCKDSTSPNKNDENAAIGTIRVLFDLNLGHYVSSGFTGDHVYNLCRSDQIFDPYFQTCREFICPQYQYARNEKCYKNETVFVDTNNQPFPDMNQPMNIQLTYHYTKELRNIPTLDTLTIENITFVAANNIHTSVACRLQIDTQNNRLKSVHAVIILNSDEGSLDRLLMLTLQDHCLENVQVNNFRKEELSSLCGKKRLMNYTATSTTIDSVNYAIVSRHGQQFFYRINNVAFTLTATKYLNDGELDEIYVCEQGVDDKNDLTCPIIVFNPDEFVLMNNTIVITGSNSMIKQEQFRIIGERAYVCNFYPSLKLAFFEFSVPQHYTSLIVMGISMLCLFLTITVYVRFKQMRTIAGKMTACVSFWLLIGQVLLLVDFDSPQFCHILAATNHFAWLSVFTWMSAIALNMAMTFGKTSVIDGAGNQARFKRFSLVSILFPSIIVGTCIGLESVEVDSKFKVGYGKQACSWMSSEMGLIVSFFVPMAASLILNTICFIVTLCGIEKSLRASSMATKGSGRADRQKCIIYAKLSSIMGFTWILGFVAAFVDHFTLWYVYIFLNGLQGLFIFLSFICNRRTLNLLRCGCIVNRSKAYSQSNINTTTSTGETSFPN